MNDLLAKLAERRLLAIVRADDRDLAVRCARVLADAGMAAVEVSLTTPGGVDAIAQLKSELPSFVLLGAGTVMSSANAEAAFEAGASFAVTPGLSQGAVRCIEIGLPLICGALTPTEIIDVLGIGAMAVKISPAKTYGPGYFKELRGPLPRAPLVAVGGVDADSAHEYVSAGAVAIGVGSPLLGAAAHGDFTGLTDRVRTFFRAVHR